VYAECLARSGADGEARAAIAVARDRLLRRAERIADPAWRDRFLHDVPAHARTIELAELALLAA
jgi:eukaryotic-like serine/threonine-protein kinase